MTQQLEWSQNGSIIETLTEKQFEESVQPTYKGNWDMYVMDQFEYAADIHILINVTVRLTSI